jgi:simple sugar transport system permease protein
MHRIRKFFLKQQPVFITIIAVLLALFIVGLILAATGRNPFNAVYFFVRGAFGNMFNTTDTISRVIPLTIAGIAFLVGAQSSVFNVGIEGQLLLGAMASAVVGYIVKLPAYIHLPLMLLAGALAGGLYALIPAWLKTKRKVNEILSTIMLNYPATYLPIFWC